MISRMGIYSQLCALLLVGQSVAETPSFTSRWQSLGAAAATVGDKDLIEYLADRPLPSRDDQHCYCLPLSSHPATESTLPSASELWKEARALGRDESLTLIAAARQAAARGDGWQAYGQLWQAHRADPLNQPLAKMLGVSEMLAEPRVGVGIRTIKEIGWLTRSYQEIATANFRVATTATPEAAIELAVSLELELAVWRQAFLPLWTSEQMMAEAINSGRSPLASTTPTMRVVLFADRQAYVSALTPLAPGVERSTGYYAPNQQTTYLFVGTEADPATRHHELTHQFLQEASRFRSSRQPGRNDGIWIVEGIATYAESLRLLPTFATLGGWESPRLQTARYRWLQLGHRRELGEMVPLAQTQLSQIPDLAQWYTDAACYVHLLLDGGDAKMRDKLLEHLESVYRRGGDSRVEFGQVSAVQLKEFLQVNDQRVATLTDGRQVTDLCLGGTQVTTEGLVSLPELPDLNWLDLAGLPVDDPTLNRLLRSSQAITRLNIERTAITDAVSDSIQQLKNLRELDVSSTRVGDRLAVSLSRCLDLRVLWASATPMTDSAATALEGQPKLERIDLQLSGVSPAAVERLRKARPQLDVNPLQIQAAQESRTR